MVALGRLAGRGAWLIGLGWAGLLEGWQCPLADEYGGTETKRALLGAGKAEEPLLGHQRLTLYLAYLPLQRLFASLIRLGSRTVISSSFSSTKRLGDGDGDCQVENPAADTVNRNHYRRHFLITQSHPPFNSCVCTVCCIMCLLCIQSTVWACTVHIHEHRRTAPAPERSDCDPARCDTMRCDTIQEDALPAIMGRRPSPSSPSRLV